MYHLSFLGGGGQGGREIKKKSVATFSEKFLIQKLSVLSKLLQDMNKDFKRPGI